MSDIERGIYRHFKGGEYEVVSTAKNSETLEDVVIYKHCGEEELWVRPLSMFVEFVKKPEYNYEGPRFKLIKDNKNKK